MKFQDLERKMRRYEQPSRATVLPGLFIAARVDGRCFTRLTKLEHPFEAPYDQRFRDHMIETARRLMTSGPSVIYAYTQSDEISLLLRRDDGIFGRRLDKLHSVLAGVASATFSLALGSPAVFDCRVSQLTSAQDVMDYFRWRQADAARNALSGHCYWQLRHNGLSERNATNRLLGLSEPERQDLLMSFGVNFNDLPSWQKRGVGLWWRSVHRSSVDVRTGERTTATRRAIQVDLELPFRDAYEDYLKGLIQTAS